jgi:hypothetical protein
MQQDTKTGSRLGDGSLGHVNLPIELGTFTKRLSFRIQHQPSDYSIQVNWHGMHSLNMITKTRVVL